MVNADQDPIELVPADHERWHERFVAERDRVRDALSRAGLEDDYERIEHVGSTAVPNLAAKDIVDLDIVVADDAVSEVSKLLADELGGTRLENSGEWHPVFREHDGQRFNDHVFAVSSDGWKVSVATRDVLAACPDRREEYERLKRDLAAAHDDLVAYSEGKSAFVERLLEVAREDDVDVRCPVPTTD
ncbi:GrpB family protein [Natronococcus sp. A-GB1]|uniref:GrpB family protein n=1 Tax=Natronococcus sp. A-GB1 TaxID=3037648 RepID=UPI00241D2AED|nr:GrpB family protein [Natronococcus sp. A-GB1]MDG5761459.1 GrpB family protein [Natronococcus sp. A-GB1]